MTLSPRMCSVHTHSTLCDGKASPEAMAAAAYAAGVRYFGVSCHSHTPIPDDEGAVLPADMTDYRAAVLALGDLCGRTVIAELHVEDDEGHLPDGTDVRAAIGVLQRIGVTTVLISAHDPESLTQALEIAAPYARLSLGVCMHADWLSQTTLYNTEVIVPDITEAFVAALRGNQVACKTLPRDHDDFICAPDGKHAHFIAPTIDISDEIECGPHLDEDLIEAEDDSGAFKLLLETEEDVVTLEESRYMISRPLCLCAESADLLEQGLRVFPGLALYDGTWEQEDAVISYFETKYGMIRL